MLKDKKCKEIFAEKEKQIKAFLNKLDGNLDNIQDIVKQVNDAILNFNLKLLIFYARKISINQKEKITVETVIQFFKNFVENLLDIQQSYWKQQQLMKNDDLLNETHANYNNNKNMMNIYLRDNYEQFKQITRNYILNNDIKIKKKIELYKFSKQLFTKKQFFKVLILKNDDCWEDFFNPNEQDRDYQIKFNSYVSLYFTSLDLPQNYDIADFVSQNQILGFFQSWIKNDKDIFIIYKLTQQKFQEAFQKFINTKNTEQKIKDITKLQSQINQQQPQQTNQPQTIEKLEQKQQNIQTMNTRKLISEISSRLQKQNQLTELDLNNPISIVQIQQFDQLQNNQMKKSFVKSQIEVNNVSLQFLSKNMININYISKSKLEQLYLIYCKQHSVITKSMTFEEIQYQNKIMNIEKFSGFCIDHKIFEIMDREEVIEEFRKNAINKRELNFEKFYQIIYNLILRNQKLNELLIKEFEVEKKKKLIPYSKKKQIKLTQHNGKLPEEVFQLLKQIKDSRNHIKKQNQIVKIRDQVKYFKKIGMKREAQQQLNNAAKKRKDIFKSLGNLSIEIQRKASSQKLTLANIDKFRDRNFDPESLLNKQQDEYLQEYPIQIKRDKIPSFRVRSEVRVKQLYNYESTKQKKLIKGLLNQRNEKIQRGLRVLNKIKKN